MSTPAAATAERTAAAAMSEAASSGAAVWRLRTPVRSAIQPGLTPAACATSSFVRCREGR